MVQMPLKPSPGFLSGLITASNISIYAALVALDANTNWPKTVRALHCIATGTVNLSDGTHAVGVALPAAQMIIFAATGYANQGIYLDNMIVSAGGTLACYLFT